MLALPRISQLSLTSASSAVLSGNPFSMLWGFKDRTLESEYQVYLAGSSAMGVFPYNIALHSLAVLLYGLQMSGLLVRRLAWQRMRSRQTSPSMHAPSCSCPTSAGSCAVQALTPTLALFSTDPWSFMPYGILQSPDDPFWVPDAEPGGWLIYSCIQNARFYTLQGLGHDLAQESKEGAVSNLDIAEHAHPQCHLRHHLRPLPIVPLHERSHPGNPRTPPKANETDRT